MQSKAGKKSQQSTKKVKTTKKSTIQSTTRSFHSGKPGQSSRRDKLAEAVLNIKKPLSPKWQSSSETPVSKPGEYLQTGADLAPIGTKSYESMLKDGEVVDFDHIDNQIVYDNLTSTKSKHMKMNKLRQTFFNTFPRQSASPAGPILQTAYTNYSIYNQPIDWANRLPGALVRITVKEKPDYTPYFDTRWYQEAMPKPSARVEIHMNSLKFLSKLEQNVLGEILGPRYNWQTGRILISVGNLRDKHANINRCFQYLHEAAFRAIEIAPHIAKETAIDDKVFKSQEKTRKNLQNRLNKALTPFQGHVPRATWTQADQENPDNQSVLIDGIYTVPFVKGLSLSDHKQLLNKNSHLYKSLFPAQSTSDHQQSQEQLHDQFSAVSLSSSEQTQHEM
jgi:hypothetical protein